MAILPNALSYIYKEFLAAPPIRNVVDAILRMTIPRSILINGQPLLLNRQDAAICAAIRFGIYEIGSRAVFSKLIHKGATVVDVGAGWGSVTLPMDVRLTLICTSVCAKLSISGWLVTTISAVGCGGIWPCTGL